MGWKYRSDRGVLLANHSLLNSLQKLRARRSRVWLLTRPIKIPDEMRACIKIDARRLSSAALVEKRRLSVKLRKQGLTRIKIGEVVGVSSRYRSPFRASPKSVRQPASLSGIRLRLNAACLCNGGQLVFQPLCRISETTFCAIDEVDMA